MRHRLLITIVTLVLCFPILGFTQSISNDSIAKAEKLMSLCDLIKQSDRNTTIARMVSENINASMGNQMIVYIAQFDTRMIMLAELSKMNQLDNETIQSAIGVTLPKIEIILEALPGITDGMIIVRDPLISFPKVLVNDGKVHIL